MRIKKKVCTLSFAEARDSGRLDEFNESRKLNIACAEAISKAITDSNYEPNHYDLETAAKTVIDTYGAARVNCVLASTVSESDGRYSRSNKEWANKVPVPPKRDTYLNSHPCLVDGIIDHARAYAQTLSRKKPSVTDQLKTARPTAEQPEKKPATKQKNGMEI